MPFVEGIPCSKQSFTYLISFVTVWWGVLFFSLCTKLRPERLSHLPQVMPLVTTSIVLRIKSMFYRSQSGFPGGSDGKESAYNVEDLGSIPGLGRSPGGEHDNPLQYSCLENPHGQRSLVGYSPWGHKESDTTVWLRTHTDDLPDPGIEPGSSAL